MARSTYSPRNQSHQIEKEKYQKESENWKLWDCPCSQIKPIVTLLDFHSTKQRLPLVDPWSRGLDVAMYPARATLQHVIKAWWKVA